MTTPKSSGTVDPRSLSAEERAIWDAMALDYWRMHFSWECAYSYSRSAAIEAAKARRALFAAESPATGAKVCENCKQTVAYTHEHRDDEDGSRWTCTPAPVAEPEKVDKETRADQIKSFLGGDDYEPTPEPDSCAKEAQRIRCRLEIQPEEDGSWTVISPEVPGCVGTGDYLDEAIDHFEDAFGAWTEARKRLGLPTTPDRCPKPEVDHSGYHFASCEQPAKPEGELASEPEHPVIRAVEALLMASECCDEEEDIAVCVQASDDLRTFWRSQAATAGGVTVEKVVEILETERAEWMSDDADKAIKDCIAAVRAQASGAKREMSEGLIVAALEKVREKWSKSAYTDTVFYLVNDCIDAIKAEYGGRP